jgi:dolichol-phosphate mannosyltransferase
MIQLSVIVPTYNEKDNVAELLRLLDHALAGISWEAVFVDDDSPDGTAALVREISQTRSNVRCLQRIGRRGLSRAVVEGMLSTAAPYLAVIDADLQHDETLLPAMLARAQAEKLDMVVGSRYVAGGSLGDWNATRASMSKLATRISRLIVKDPLTDPMSGFFLVSRPAFEAAVRNLSGEGFKILLDLFASSPKPLRFAELPYTFRKRHAGESKLDSAVLWEYLLLIIDKMVGRWVPARFVLFSAVGASGLIVHFATLATLYQGMSMDFAVAQGIATLIAMTSNYALNNAVTYRDRRKRGLTFLTGLLSFYMICGLGVIGNVGVANFFFLKQYSWLLAGFAGALVGTVWNYAVSSIFTWGRR